MNDTEDEEIVLRVEKDPLLGKTIAGRYEIISVLGSGGMGVVYKARQIDVGRFVAVKTLHSSRIADSQVIQRFRTEAQAVSRVRHPNTVTLFDFGVSQDGIPFLVMEIIDGVSFRNLLTAEKALPLARVNHIFQQVCAALAFAHDSGIVHKDLKPENIMLSNRQGVLDRVYVLDFGIAGLLEANNQQINEIIGSPPYMSPEQCSMQGGIDHRSDIYSLGICIFEALCGKFPFKARSAMEMLDGHVNQTPLSIKDLGARFSTYESVSQLISRALAKRPEKRPQSVLEFALELDDASKKDAKRGMLLRTRASLEIDSPRLSEFVEIQNDESASGGAVESERNQRHNNIVNNIKALIAGENGPESKIVSCEMDSDPRYHFSSCPHCDAPTQAGISLCLACGRSLAAKNDFSKIRASRGDFSLPKIQELGAPTPTGTSVRCFSQHTRMAMLKSGRAWTRSWGLYLIGLALLAIVFIAAGGGQYVMNRLAGNAGGANTNGP